MNVAEPGLLRRIHQKVPMEETRSRVLEAREQFSCISHLVEFGPVGAINCGYTSFEQCRATVSGIYGFCTPNPYPGTSYGRGGTWNLTPTSRGRSYRTER